MSFTATTEVVPNLRWRHISKLFLDLLLQQEGLVLDPKNEDKILNHYSYMLQLASWKRELNWEPSYNRVTVSVPNEWNIDNFDFGLKVSRDALSDELVKIMGEVTPQRVLSHFSMSNN